MSSNIDEAQVRKIAKLARLRLSDAEVRLFQGQLGNILGYIEQLNAVDVTGKEPMAHPLPVTSVMREDAPGPMFEPDVALSNSPQRQNDYFKVPAVLDPNAGA